MKHGGDFDFWRRQCDAPPFRRAIGQLFSRRNGHDTMRQQISPFFFVLVRVSECHNCRASFPDNVSCSRGGSADGPPKFFFCVGMGARLPCGARRGPPAPCRAAPFLLGGSIGAIMVAAAAPSPNRTGACGRGASGPPPPPPGSILRGERPASLRA
jgi:hypothetical protein